jgi:hypothetical protein
LLKTLGQPIAMEKNMLTLFHPPESGEIDIAVASTALTLAFSITIGS